MPRKEAVLRQPYFFRHYYPPSEGLAVGVAFGKQSSSEAFIAVGHWDWLAKISQKDALLDPGPDGWQISSQRLLLGSMCQQS